METITDQAERIRPCTIEKFNECEGLDHVNSAFEIFSEDSTYEIDREKIEDLSRVRLSKDVSQARL